MKKLPKLTESNGERIQRLKTHVIWNHPHLARQKNLSDREHLENKLDKLSKTKKIGKIK